jgi:hypothetical protein
MAREQSMSHYQHGNAITEYLMPAVLVVIVCISSFMALGGQFGSSMKDLKSHMTASSETAQRQTEFQKQQSDAIKLATQVNLPPPTSTLPPNALPIISGTPEQTRDLISTLGANGVTDLLANRISLLAEQWMTEGKITEAQASLLAKLSNEGHQVAEYEKMLSEALLQGKTSMMVDGKSYSLTDGLGFYTMSSDDVWDLNPQAANPLFRPFAQIYQEFLQNKSSYDPALSREISALVIQISAVDDALKWSAEDFLDSYRFPSITEDSLWHAASGHFQDNIDGAPISRQVSTITRDITQYNSTQVCTQSGGSDDGQRCTQ